MMARIRLRAQCTFPGPDTSQAVSNSLWVDFWMNKGCTFIVNLVSLLSSQMETNI